MKSHVRRTRFVNALVSASLLCFGTASASPRVRVAVHPSQDVSQVDRLLRRYDLVTIDPTAKAKRVRNSGKLKIETPDQTFEISLGLRDLRSPRYVADATGDGDEKAGLPDADVTTYAGTVDNVPGATARFSVEDGKLSGVIFANDEMYFVEPLSDFSLAGADTDYVVYRGSDVNPDAIGTCATSAVEEFNKGMEIAGTAATAAYHTVDIATEADYDYVTALGGATAANNEILAIMNQVEGVYQNELGITFNVVYQHAWTTSADPYSSTDPSTMLSEFTNYWNANMASHPRDLTHMWTGRDMDGSTIGIAWTGVVCGAPSYSYGVSQRYSTQPAKFILSAHEIGHNFSASHSDGQAGCTNTIMGSAVGTGFTFCTYSRTQINNWVASHGACIPLGTDTGGGGTGGGGTGGGGTTTPKSVASIGTYSSTTGTFALRNTNGAGAANTTFAFGPAGSKPVVGDWDGNGTTTAGAFSTTYRRFYLTNANAAGSSTYFSLTANGTAPVAGDWDGNRTQTVGLYNPTSKTFYLRNTNTSGTPDLTITLTGVPTGAVPVTGDWDGDGRDGVGVYVASTGTFYLRNTLTTGAPQLTFTIGVTGGTPIAGDWTGTGHDGVGVYNAATGSFALRNANTTGTADNTFVFGSPGLKGIAGNWDGL